MKQFKTPSITNFKQLFTLVVFILSNSVLFSQTVVNSFNELLPYLEDDNYPVVLDDNSKNCTRVSVGEIIDEGSNNHILKIAKLD